MTKTVALATGGMDATGSATCRRMAKREAIAGLIASLTSCEAGYITGTHIAICGGLYMN